MTPIPILRSRAFWTAIVDAVISLALLVIGHLQPVIVILIAAFTADDIRKTWAAVHETEIRLRAK